MWSPPDPENVISDDVIDNADHDDRLGKHESAMDVDMNDEANETIDKAEDDNERELTDPLTHTETHTESSEIHDQLEVDEETLEYVEYDAVSESIETWKDSFNTEDSKTPLLVNVTSDGANGLKGTRTGVAVRLRSLYNKLLLHGHCIKHRCQFELPSSTSWLRKRVQMSSLIPIFHLQLS